MRMRPTSWTLGWASLCAACLLSGGCGVSANVGSGLRCPTGKAACPDRCAMLSSDRANCGACGTACGVGQACWSGVCAPDCPQGSTRCGDVCANAQTDQMN